MKFRNMKEIGEYIKKAQQEGDRLEQEINEAKLLGEEYKTVMQFHKLLVKEIGD